MNDKLVKCVKKRVAVLMGGFSGEREVSLSSGKGVVNSLKELGHDVIEVDVTRDIAALVNALTPKPDVAINMLHGHWGEDGCMQGLLEMMDIPYTNSGVLGSAVSMNKDVARRLCELVGIRCPQGEIVTWKKVGKNVTMEPPYVIKPIGEGSSLGVYIIKDKHQKIPDDVQWTYGESVLVEKYIPGREIHAAVMGDRALGAIEICPHEGFYDYDAKYTDGKAEHIMPAPVPPGVYAKILEWSLLAHKTLGCRGISRSDFRYNDQMSGEKGLYYLETNPQPGMTPLSLVPEIARHFNISFSQMVQWMLEDASCHR